MCICCSRQVYCHCPMRSRESANGDKMEPRRADDEFLDQWYSTTPWFDDSYKVFDKSCDLRHRYKDDHGAVYPTISDKESRQQWYSLLQHSHGLSLIVVGSQCFLLLDLVVS